jgi:hypothetical protein
MLLTSSVEAQQVQKVHAVLVIMDADASIGDSVKIDGDNIRELLQNRVDNIYETRVKTLYSSAGEATVSNIQREIRALRPGPDDVVLFYFSGHGGMVSQTDRRTYLLVTDDVNIKKSTTLLRADVEAAVTAHNCRLHLVITDCCSSSPEDTGARNYVDFAAVRGTTNRVIRDLFGEHKGLFHVNGATEGQYGWCLKNRGGVFTEALIPAISTESDRNGDGFVEWSEVADVAKRQTGIYWGRLRVDTSNPQATLQVPRVYSIPDRLDGRHTEFNTTLWDLGNRYSDLKVSFNTDKDRYTLKELMSITVRPENDCYLTLLDWDASGNFVQLFPNKFDKDNRLRAGKTYTIPQREADYEFFMSGPKGIERLKIIAVTNRSVSNEINEILALSDNPENPYRSHIVIKDSNAAVPRLIGVQQVSKLLNKEDKILKILEELDPDEWTEAREEIDVR